MAELAESKQRNLAFLKQLEQQRLQKTCTKIIDLRGKVAGECQAYQFGNLTHYLDDRAYLIAKQLLVRFDGRYTIGVNEALLKALKSLPRDNNQTQHKQESKPILARDKDSIQLLSFDQLLQRKEPRIFYSTAIELRISDVLYHANTVDITTSSIRIVMKRAFTLSQGDSVTINFTEFSSKPSATQMAQVNYSIFKVEHDDLRSYAILVRQRDDNTIITQWLDNWSQQHNRLEHLDLDDLLLNLASHYYLRLFTATMASPLFWLSNQETEAPLQILNLTNLQQQLGALISEGYTADFSVLPIDQLTTQQRLLVIVYLQQDSLKSVVVAVNDRKALTDTLHWCTQLEQAHVLLIQSHSIALELSLLEPELEQLKMLNEDNSNALIEQLAAISHLAVVTDISTSFQNILPATSSKNTDAEFVIPESLPWQGTVPKPSPLCPYIKVKNQRYFIKTSVSLNLQQASFDVITNDVSVSGVSLTLDGYIEAELESNTSLNFTRWQSQTKTVKLNAVPYTIKHVEYWQGTTILGLERNINACAESINRFFVSAIERNKEQLVQNDQSYFVSQQSRVLNDAISKVMPTIPLYLGMDANNKRILQALANHSTNQNYPHELWSSLQQLVTFLSEHLKSAGDRIHFGVYCYRDNADNWQVTTDYHLSKASQKALFINRAIQCQQFYFFHCTLSPIKSTLLAQQDDLNQQLLTIRKHSSHKVKQIREVLNSLFAVGELTDITDILTAVYQ